MPAPARPAALQDWHWPRQSREEGEQDKGRQKRRSVARPGAHGRCKEKHVHGAISLANRPGMAPKFSWRLDAPGSWNIDPCLHTSGTSAAFSKQLSGSRSSFLRTPQRLGTLLGPRLHELEEALFLQLGPPGLLLSQNRHGV